eukprot:12189537-Ditylum_brightwellii.AAC.1
MATRKNQDSSTQEGGKHKKYKTTETQKQQQNIGKNIKITNNPIKKEEITGLQLTAELLENAAASTTQKLSFHYQLKGQHSI